MFTYSISPLTYEISKEVREKVMSQNKETINAYLLWLNADLGWLDIPANSDRLQLCYYGLSSYLFTYLPFKKGEFSNYGMRKFKDTPVMSIFQRMLTEVETYGALFVVTHSLVERNLISGNTTSFIAENTALLFRAACYEVLGSKSTTDYMRDLISLHLSQKDKTKKAKGDGTAYNAWLSQCHELNKQRAAIEWEIVQHQNKIRELRFKIKEIVTPPFKPS